MPRGLTRVVILAASVFVAGGCSAGQPGTPTARTTLRITERDFHIAAPKLASSPDVRLLVHNKGPEAHELLVVRATSSHLPLRPDGLTVDEETLKRAIVGVLEPGSPGSVRQLLLHLRPGRYIVFCNMSGHFLAGMHRELVVQ